MPKQYTITDLITVMAKLRDPDGGCPWDLQQDFKSIAPYTIEEAYEVLEAINNNDMQNLREELGDLLLQPIYHAQMAAEGNHFTIHDVINDITTKMIHRHPHVFSDTKATTPEDVNAIWDAKKQEEKASQTSILDDIPQAFPALLRAHKLQKQAAKVGFEWPDITGVIDKLKEETEELREASATGDPDQIADELGDVMFVLVNYARMNGLNAEILMRAANAKFERRFKYVESQIEDMEAASLDEMEAQWQAAKKLEDHPKHCQASDLD